MTLPSDFIPFLLKAKRATYAAQGDDASVPPLLPASKQLEYRESDWLYRDVYFGGAFFAGQETVYFQDRPLWSMVYAGGVLDPQSQEVFEIYAFLRQALRAVNEAEPYRGVPLLEAEPYRYRNESQGTIGDFWGLETISRDLVPVYQLRYSGGTLR